MVQYACRLRPSRAVLAATNGEPPALELVAHQNLDRGIATRLEDAVALPADIEPDLAQPAVRMVQDLGADLGSPGP